MTTATFIPIIQEEPPSEYRHPDGTVYRRTGYCCHCGSCCSDGDPFAGEQTVPPGHCRILKKDENGVFLCSDRTSSVYLNGCNVWPSIPEHIKDHPNCTYKFEKGQTE